ncbi:MAG: hypothetical protein R3B09_27895 [Nannocystaceae bacterium]
MVTPLGSSGSIPWTRALRRARAPGRVALAAALLGGCTTNPDAAPKTRDAPAPEATPEPDPEAPARPDAAIPYAPKSELPPIEVSAAPSTCPALPTLGAKATEAQRALVPYAAAIRRLACEPALYGETTAGLAAALGLPAEAEVGFTGPLLAHLRLPVGVTVDDVAAVFGIAAPKVHVSWRAYHALTHLGSNPSTGAFDLYAPGRVNLGVAYEVDRYGDDAGVLRVVDAPRGAAIDRDVRVGMDDGAVKVLPDADAVPLVVSALAQLDARPELLSKAPDEAKPAIGLAGERYRVAETSIHGATVVRGLSLNPQRTVLPADEFAAALGLKGARATCVNREHDVWKLEAGGTTKIRWRGLELNVDVDVVRGADPKVPLDGLHIDFITVFPAGA